VASEKYTGPAIFRSLVAMMCAGDEIIPFKENKK
jgi:hypothetical protein